MFRCLQPKKTLPLLLKDLANPNPTDMPQNKTSMVNNFFDKSQKQDANHQFHCLTTQIDTIKI